MRVSQSMRRVWPALQNPICSKICRIWSDCHHILRLNRLLDLPLPGTTQKGVIGQKLKNSAEASSFDAPCAAGRRLLRSSWAYGRPRPGQVFLWLPSQYGELAVLPQLQRYTFCFSVTWKANGRKSVPLWEPSQNGALADLSQVQR